jgi:hypothetical protein
MKCSDVERVLPEVIDGDGDAELQLHLQSCPTCAELVADLKLIASEAHEPTESAEPPARVWVAIANQLRAEGIIRDPEAVPGRPVFLPTPARRWNAWWLAPVAVAILAAGSYQLTHQKNAPAAPQAVQQPLAQPAMPAPQAAQVAANQPATRPVEPAQRTPAGKQVAQLDQDRNPPSTGPAAENAEVTGNVKAGREISAPANAEDERFLSEVSERAPGMRTTYENQLRAVNTEISETQAYIRRFPADADARQHLMEVYQQKALLYQMALDRIQ